ncbi:MAG: biopolymer transporter ExbD [Bacteroidales bacterium]|nr:biopolymer transporter ExbD [Bacteroidales bacterium]MBR4095159.1 biopolymer transporter ExbD [Bacteroidales bacterium]
MMAIKRKAEGINASSSADIAFLLLIFWLTTTTMNSDKGLQRRLPPMPDENQQQEDVKVNRRNIIQVKINSNDRIIAGGQIMEISEIKDKIVEFVTNPMNLETLPEKEMKEIEGFGQYAVSKGVVSLQNDRGTSYNAYLQVQNELVKAFNEIRDDFAVKNYGKKYNALDEDKQKIIREAIPQSISEAEPKDIGKRR